MKTPERKFWFGLDVTHINALSGLDGVDAMTPYEAAKSCAKRIGYPHPIYRTDVVTETIRRMDEFARQIMQSK